MWWYLSSFTVKSSKYVMHHWPQYRQLQSRCLALRTLQSNPDRAQTWIGQESKSTDHLIFFSDAYHNKGAVNLHPALNCRSVTVKFKHQNRVKIKKLPSRKFLYLVDMAWSASDKKPRFSNQVTVWLSYVPILGVITCTHNHLSIPTNKIRTAWATPCEK